MTHMNNYELSYDEWQVVERMRNLGPYATFHLEKRPTSDMPRGRLISITSEVKQNLYNLGPRRLDVHSLTPQGEAS